MLNSTFARALRTAGATALVAGLLLLQSQAATASSSQAIFAFSGGVPVTGTRLQIVAGSTIIINDTSRGWYLAGGSSNGVSPTNNYIVGQCSTDACGEPDNLYHNYFVFTLPAGAVITSASLLLDVPAVNGFISLGNEAYTIYDVTTPIGNFGSTTSVAIYDDLGAGTVYGSRVYSIADLGTTTTIPLNAAALAYLNANRGQQVAFGGAAQFVSIAVPVLDDWQLLALLALTLFAVAAVPLRYRRA